MPSANETVDRERPSHSAWPRRAALVASCIVAGAAAAPLSETVLDGLGWATDAPTIFIVCCLPVLAALCFSAGRLDRRAWWIYGVPTATAYVVANLHGSEAPFTDPEALMWLPVAATFVAFYASALTIAAWLGSRSAGHEPGG